MNTPLTVASLVGQAWALAADGTRRALQVGDRLRGDETLIVAPGAQVDLDFGDSRVISFVGEQTASVASAVELAGAPTQHSLQMIKPLLAADKQDANERPVVLMQEGHRFVHLVRISEIVESDGLTPLTVARIQEVLNPLEMAYPDFSEDPREWREHRGGDEPGGYGPDGELAARYPGVQVELQGAGEDGIYSADEIGLDGTVTAWVTLNNQTREGDVLVVRDGNGNVLLERVVTSADLLDGILVKVPVEPRQAGVTVHAVITTPDGSSSEDSALRPVENVPPVMIDSEARSDADSDKIDLDISQYFTGNTPLTYTVKDLPPGLSFDPLTGKITGTLDSSASQGGADNDGRYVVTLTATDKAGNSSSKELVWTVTNPPPVANDDVQTITEDSVGGAGNVLTGLGADNGSDAADKDPDGDILQVIGVAAGALGGVPIGQLGVAIEGKYGSLTINADGSYTYLLDNDNPLVKGMKDGDFLRDVFTYTISDREGGQDTATLTLIVNGRTDGDPAVTVPDLNGTDTGSNSIAENATGPVTGTFTVTAPDGLNAISVGGTVITAAELAGLGSTPVVIAGSEGTLTLIGFNPLTGEVTYSYQQTGTNKDHQAGKDSVTDSFAITVTDNGGATSAPGNLVILITDTAPQANPDVNSVTEDEGVPATGNVMTGSGADDLGGDATTVTGVTTGTVTTEVTGNVGSVITGQYGTLILGSDGNYTYTLDDNNVAVNALKDGEILTDTFSYTIKDEDGDFSTTTLTITINGNTDGIPSIEPLDRREGGGSGPEAAGHVTVYESGLTTDGPAGKEKTADGSIKLTAPDGLLTVTVGDGSNAITLSLAELNDLAGAPHQITTDYGTLTLTGFTVVKSAGGVPTEATLQYSYTLDRPYDNETPTEDKNALDLISLIVQDIGGEKAAGKLEVNIIDDAPSVGTVENKTVSEAGLPGGSQQGDVTAPTSVSAGLAVRVGADNTVGGGRADVRFLDDQTALANLGLSSGHDSSGSPVALQYVVSPDGHTITAYRGEGRAAGDQVFNVVINNPDNNAASYTFTLTGPLNHGKLSALDLPFAFGVTDGDNDSDNGTFIVTVTDDTPAPVKNILINEDSCAATPANTFNTSADANSSNTIVRGINGGPALEAVTNSDGSVTYNYPAGTSDGDKSFFGSITVNVNGSITFVPAPNYSNAGGADKFQYETVSGSDINTVEVIVNVTPVSDAPGLGREAASVITDEDVAVALGFKAPVVTDGQDQNGSANGDFPELLGVITLSGIPAGAVLLDGSNGDAVLFASTGAPITIVISDGQHVSGITGNTLTLTTAQFEALKVLPAAHAHENFIVEMTVTSYEVDQNGNALPDVPGAPSSITVEVDVLAVTDPVSLTFDDLTKDRNLTINEDSNTYDLSDVLNVSYPNNDGNTTGDLDGSEVRWFEISGLPIGSKVTTANGVIEVTAQNPVVTVPAPGLSTSATGLPQMVITPPPDYSGPSIPVTVTLKAQDHDGDSSEAKPAIEQDSVTLNLQVNPVADKPVVVGVTTPEDTPVAFLQHVALGDTDGSEELLAITVKGIPDGWVILDHQGVELIPTAGELVISAADVTSGAYKDYTLQPPAHSSLDATFKLDIQVRDHGYRDSPVQDTQTFSNIDLKVTVTPVAERVNTDTDNSGTNDLTLTPGHDYTTPGAEDTWFNLGQETGFKLADGWHNEDSGSEKTYALFTPTLVAGDGSQSDAMGSSFRYSTDGGKTWIEQIFGGDSIEVPIEHLNTLQFKAAPNFSGAFSINVQALTRDYDEDDLAGRTVDQLTPAELAALSYNEAISGSAELLNILILPVADAATATVTAHVRGNEDEAMAFSIRPSSSDKSETFEVTVSAIPDGAKLMYGGIALTADATGLPPGFTIVHGTDGTWSVEIVGFDPALGSAMTITAPRDSNVPFALKVATVSVDVLEIPGDPGSPYIDKSSPYELNILVSPKGVADPAILTIIDPVDQSFEEATLDANGGVFLRELVTDAKLTDTDGSESLSFKISNLPSGFSLVGGTLIGVGIWSLTEAQLKTAKLITPPNFNGTATFNLYAVTTENDGDSLTQLHEVSLRVEPSAEATINLSATIDEDVSAALSFAIQHKNGDIDEKLDAVWLNASDVEGALDFGLTYGVNGVSLAQAALDGMEGIKQEGGWYKLTGAALDNIYAQGRVNWSGSASFGVRYFITDPAADGTVQDKQIAVDDTYGIKVNPVTDQPTLAVIGGKTTTLDDPGSVMVQLTIGNLGGDYDGSEHLNRIIFENVPDGVIVNGAEYLGNDQWMLVSSAVFNSELNPTVTLSVQSRAGGLVDHQIKVTVITEDSNNGQQLTATTDIRLTTTFTGGESTPPAEILRWEQTFFEPTEDQAFILREGIAAEIESGVTDNGFTVSLTNLPPGTTVTGMRLTLIDGREVWTASGTGANAELQALLASITVTPPADWNKHFGDFVYDANLTTYIPSGDRSEAVVTVRQTVNPVTDDADITITAPTVSEGNDLSINIDISNGSDDPNWTLIDGILYVTLDEPAGMQGGVLKDNAGNPLTLSTVTGVSGVPNGSYYMIDVSGSVNRVGLLYTPKDEHVSGSINLSVIARGQEQDSNIIKATTATQTATVTPVNSGYDFSVTSVSGRENAFAQAAADKSNVIALSVTDNGLVDNDGSEVVGTILLKGLPKGFLVYVGDSADDAVLASLGSNAGDNGDGINTWMLGSGALPKYIGILPPAHWSGTVSDLQLVINSQETSLSEVLATTRDFSLTVEPVADGVQLTPTPSFGKEGDVIQLNLNAEMSDLGAASPTDDSVETINLQFKGLGEHAGFYIDGVLISGGQNVTYADGVYTLRGLTQDDVGKLGFVQGASAIGEMQVRAQTVESGNGDTSAWSHEVGAEWGKVAVSMTRQYGTTGDDKLLWTGEMINGRGGDDVVQLRFGEGLSGTALSSTLRNIETIDMTGSGANSITSLSAKDVFDITDARNTLRIDGDAGGVDRLSLDGGSGWTLNAGAGVAGYEVYTATIASHHVTLEVASGIHIE